MTFEQEFLRDLESWLESQITVNEMAMQASRQVIEEDKDQRAVDAYIRYESKLDAYRYLLGKFDNYKSGKAFHDLPDQLFDQRHY